MWYDISDTYMNDRAESKIFLSMWVSLFEVQELVERLHEKGIEVKAPTLAKYLSEFRRQKQKCEFSFQVQDPRRSYGVLRQSIPVPFSTREPSSAGCLFGTLPSNTSHAG